MPKPKTKSMKLRLGIVIAGVLAGYALRWILGPPPSEFFEPSTEGAMRPKSQVMDSNGGS
ncbi:MAG: hypothetical protein VX189_09635 [Planctomycetota bacterium]|nr:hypothetical protein [Planctomycetota bacterium]